MSHRWQGDREVSLGRMGLSAPEGWLRKPPAVDFILAEFILSRAEGDAADVRLTVSSVGGSVEQNVDRWRGQFGGKPQKESLDRVEIAGVEVTLVDFCGTYVDQRGPFAPTVERPDYRLLGAILRSPEGHGGACRGVSRFCAVAPRQRGAAMTTRPGHGDCSCFAGTRPAPRGAFHLLPPRARCDVRASRVCL